jgi:hypothetical protein
VPLTAVDQRIKDILPRLRNRKKIAGGAKKSKALPESHNVNQLADVVGLRKFPKPNLYFSVLFIPLGWVST